MSCPNLLESMSQEDTCLFEKHRKESPNRRGFAHWHANGLTEEESRAGPSFGLSASGNLLQLDDDAQLRPGT